MFFVMNDIDFASYANDNIPYVSFDSMEDVIRILENGSIKLFKWFFDNMMKANKDKCHLIVSSNEHVSVKLDNIEIENSNCERLPGVKIDSKLNFKEHLDGTIKKASRKINALSRIAPYMNIAKRRLLVNTFFASQFNYCYLVWMCYDRSVNNKINRLHKRCLRIVYSESVSSFEELLNTDRSVSVHVKNIKTLAIEMFKVSNKLTVPLMNEIFVKPNNAYNLRKPSEFVRPKVHSIFYGRESISYLGPQIWDMIPVEMKNLTTISTSKGEVKN